MSDPTDAETIAALTPSVTRCEACDLAETLWIDRGQPMICECGNVFAGPEFVMPPREIEPDTTDDDAIETARRILPSVLDALAVIGRFSRESGKGSIGPRAYRCPLASMQGASDGSTADATDRQVEGLSRLLLDPRRGDRVRAAFVAHLARLADDMAPETIADLPAARDLADHLDSLDRATREILRTVQREHSPGATWEDVAATVAAAHAPQHLLLRWQVYRPARGLAGRMEPTPDQERQAVGGAILSQALRLWRGEYPERPEVMR